MTYIMSDIHGCYEQFQKMMEVIKLRAEDHLYVLGDLVDRGKGSMKLILDIREKPNITALCGNHDHIASIMLNAFSPENIEDTPHKLVDPFTGWLSDGGMATYQSFLRLEEDDRRNVLDFLSQLPLYKKINVGHQNYLLCHTVPSRNKMKKQGKYQSSDFLIGKPEYDKVYFEDWIIVTGHTPTQWIDPASQGKIWQGNHHIAVDCGAVFGNPMGCICLDTLEEYYVT